MTRAYEFKSCLANYISCDLPSRRQRADERRLLVRCFGANTKNHMCIGQMLINHRLNKALKPLQNHNPTFSKTKKMWKRF